MPSKLLAEAVRASMQVHCAAGRPAQALERLQQQLPVLRDARVLQEDMEGLWMVAATSAAATRDAQLLQQALGSAKAWAVEADADDAGFMARLAGAEAAAALTAQQAQRAAVHFSRAAHLCPTSASLWTGLAAAVVMRPDDGGRSAEAALRLVEAPVVEQAVAAGKAAVAATEDMPPAGTVRWVVNARPRTVYGRLVCPQTSAAITANLQALPEALMEAGTAAALAARRASTEQMRRHLSSAVRCLHESPANPRLWYMCALTARKAALLGEGSREGLEHAWRWCRAAEGAAAAAIAAH